MNEQEYEEWKKSMTIKRAFQDADLMDDIIAPAVVAIVTSITFRLLF